MIEAAQSLQIKPPFAWNEGVTDLSFKDSPAPIRQSYNGVVIEIDTLKAASFLQKHGLTSQQISQITLKLSRENTIGSIAEFEYEGIYRPQTKTLEVSAKAAVDTYYSFMYACKEVISGERPPVICSGVF